MVSHVSFELSCHALVWTRELAAALAWHQLLARHPQFCNSFVVFFGSLRCSLADQLADRLADRLADFFADFFAKILRAVPTLAVAPLSIASQEQALHRKFTSRTCTIGSHLTCPFLVEPPFELCSLYFSCRSSGVAAAARAIRSSLLPAYAPEAMRICPWSLPCSCRSSGVAAAELSMRCRRSPGYRPAAPIKQECDGSGRVGRTVVSV
jgi:hypothetical protein